MIKNRESEKSRKYTQGLNREILPFREGLFGLNENGTGYLLANRCQHCNITFFPKREFCVKCYRDDQLKDIKLSTQGTLYTFTVVYHSIPDFSTPYMIGYIDLERDGVRIFAPISSCKPEDLKIGMDMELVFSKGNKKPRDEKDTKLLGYGFRPKK